MVHSASACALAVSRLHNRVPRAPRAFPSLSRRGSASTALSSPSIAPLSRSRASPRGLLARTSLGTPLFPNSAASRTSLRHVARAQVFGIGGHGTDTAAPSEVIREVPYLTPRWFLCRDPREVSQVSGISPVRFRVSESLPPRDNARSDPAWTGALPVNSELTEFSRQKMSIASL